MPDSMYPQPDQQGGEESFELIDLIGATADTVVLRSRATADAGSRARMEADGEWEYGDGTGAFDLKVGRQAAGVWGPSSSGAYDLGSATKQWRDIHSSRNIYVGAELYIGGANRVITADDDDIIAIKRGTNPQTLRVYNLTSAVINNEYIRIGWAANVAYVMAYNTGGTSRDLVVGTSGTNPLYFRTNDTNRAYFNGTGHLLWSTTNTLDIGSASAAPRSIYWGTQALGPNGTATNPAYSFSSETNLGFYRVSTSDMALVIGGVIWWRANSAAGFGLRSTVPLSWGAETTSDLFLLREAANILALRNSTNNQTFYIYGTYTDASNYERLRISHFGSSDVSFTAQAAGTGSVRALVFTTGASWALNTSGHWTPTTDGALDLGTTSTRVRSAYLGTAVIIGTNPASSGTVRLANTASVAFRNAANLANFVGLTVNSSDVMILCDNAMGLRIANNTGASLGFFSTTPVTRRTGWGTATGTATRTTFDTATVTLSQLAERVKAMIDDLHATAGYGLFAT